MEPDRYEVAVENAKPRDNKFVGTDPRELEWLDGEKSPEHTQPPYDPDSPLVVDADYDD